MDQYAYMLLNGLSWGATVFLTAAGLTLVFGILHILNFAHGGFVMLGAYLAYSLIAHFENSTVWTFIAAMIVCTIILGILGFLIDRSVFERLRGVSESYSLIATYAVLLVCQGAVKLIWGVDVLSVSPPPDLMGSIQIAGIILPKFVLFVIACGFIVFLLLDYIFTRTTVGKTVQSVAVDPLMSALLGVNVRFILTGTVVVGIGLAGLAGAILSVNQGLTPDMGSSLIIQAFGAIIVGGMGNIRGAFSASIFLGIATVLGDQIFSEVPGLFFYISLIALIMWRPQGFMRGVTHARH